MNYWNKKVLCIDLSHHSSEIKSFPELVEFLGGLPLGLKLGEMYADSRPTIFTIGPLNGFFPFVSKTCILDLGESIKNVYLGGSLSTRLQFAGFDALILNGISEDFVFLQIDPQGAVFLDSEESFFKSSLPGRSAKIEVKEKALLDEYFETPDDFLFKTLGKRKVRGIIVNATNSFFIKKPLEYSNLYTRILDKGLQENPFLKLGDKPSCSGCPLGCENSKIGEASGNVLAHSLVACDYMSSLYSDPGIVFSCLNVLGYDYKHEDLEQIPKLVERLWEELNQKI